MKPEQKHFAVLDGLRGIAVLLVVLSHLSNFGFNIVAVDFSGIGKSGVYLFFVLSAFLLTYQFLEREMRESFTPYAIGNYFWRRALRVLPLFYFVVLASALTTYFFSDRLNGRGLPFTIPANEIIPHLTFNAGTEVLWSVPVEFKFYFLLPLLALSFILSGKKGIYADMLICILSIAGVTTLFPAANFSGASVELGYYLPVFICGCFCASVVYKTSLKMTRGLANLIALTTGALVTLTIPSIFSFFFHPVSPSFFHKWFIFYGIVWSIFLYAVVHSHGYIYRLFTSKILLFFGKVSFSLYLLHFPILLVTRKVAPESTLAAWGAVMLIIIISYLSYRYFERPMSRLHAQDVLTTIKSHLRALKKAKTSLTS
jgi:peptidoglycan/LPS O-acetylase OafA/YrhL